MAMPRKLKHMNIYLDNDSWIGVAESFTPATLARKTEAYRGSGMPGAVKVDMGFEDDALDTQMVISGFDERILKMHAQENIDGLLLRFMGSYQREDTGAVVKVEFVQKGRIVKDEIGEQKTGENAQTTISFANTYYKCMVDDKDVREVDLLAMIDKVDGNDRLAKHRAAIGV